MNEARALRASSVELVNFLRHSSHEATQSFFSLDLIPTDVKRKVEKDSDNVDQMVDCLIERVKISPGDYGVIVGTLEGIPGSSHVVNLLKSNYAKKTGRKLQLVVQGTSVPHVQTPDSGVRVSAPHAQTAPDSGVSEIQTPQLRARRPAQHDNGVQDRQAPPVIPDSTSTKWPTVRCSLAVVVGVVGVISIVVYYFVVQGAVSPPMEKHAVQNDGRSTGTTGQPEEVTCHEIDSSKSLEEYLKDIDEEPEILCDRLELENCIKLKHNRKLDSFYMAKDYLSQRAEACWEDIVSMLCEMKEKKLARILAEKKKINYERYCNGS